jgi:hypothetical protein
LGSILGLLRHRLRSQARVDRRRLLHRQAGRRRDGSYCGRPACPRDGGQAMCPQIRGTDLKALGFNIGAQVARGSMVPAGCFPCKRVGSYHQPADPRWARRQQHRGVQDAHNLAWKLWQRCSTARLVPRYLIAITMNGTNRTALTICSSRPLPGSAPAWVKAPRCPTHRLWGGDDGLLPVYRSSAVLSA